MSLQPPKATRIFRIQENYRVQGMLFNDKSIKF